MLRCKNLLETRSLHLALQSQNTVLEDMVRQRTQDLEKALEELRNTQERQVQQERLRALGEMSGGIAHDLNNHLTVLVGYTELLLLNDARMLSNRPMALHYLQTVRSAAHDSAGVVGRLREFGRRREVKDVFLPLNLPRLIQDAATFTQPKWRNLARATGRTINVRLELNPLPDVAGDAGELREVIASLIFNAVDAMPQGGDITLRTRRAGNDAVAFEVVDTGIGMTEGGAAPLSGAILHHQKRTWRGHGFVGGLRDHQTPRGATSTSSPNRATARRFPCVCRWPTPPRAAGSLLLLPARGRTGRCACCWSRTTRKSARLWPNTCGATSTKFPWRSAGARDWKFLTGVGSTSS